MTSNGLRVVLFSTDGRMIEAWTKEFEGVEEVEIFQCELEDVPASDCLVVEGNSFAIMDGEFDIELRLQFPDAQQNVAEVVGSAYYGEIPVGQSVLVPTGDEVFRWLAYTPTVRFPRSITAESVYDAMRVTLLAIKQRNMENLEGQAIADELGEEYDDDIIEVVAIPGFGIDSGVGAFKAAHMMRLAYESVFEREEQAFTTWDEVDPLLKKLNAV